MKEYEAYMERAADDRKAAAESNLPNQKRILEQSARNWEMMAHALEKSREETAVRVAESRARSAAMTKLPFRKSVSPEPSC